MNESEKTHQAVKDAYGKIAANQSCGCGCSCGPVNPYTVADHPLPESDLGLSCGNPVELAALKPGETVLDLGSGAGRDAFLAALITGPAGQVIGVDMTPEMLALSRANALKLAGRAGMAPVEFREGYIEQLPVDDGTVDLILSNCVINLSTDKPQVFREAYRVLKPGGRITVSDMVLNRELPAEMRSDLELYAACIAGALKREDYLAAIAAAGFTQIELLKDITYQSENACGDPSTEPIAHLLEGAAASITVRAVK